MPVNMAAVGRRHPANGGCSCSFQISRLEAPMWATPMETEQNERLGIFPYLGNMLFGRRSKRASSSGMTFEERVRVIASLLSVRRRGERENLYRWADEVKRRFLTNPSLRPLVDGFPKSSVETQEYDKKGNPPLDTEEKLYEDQIEDFIETGLRLAEEHPISSFGGEAQYLISKNIDENLWDSGPMRLLKWSSPILVALIFGGVDIW